MNWQDDKDFCTAYNNFTCDYIPAQIELAYYFWKAARESIKVELPYCYHICGNGDNYDKDEMLEALDKVGVKY